MGTARADFYKEVHVKISSTSFFWGTHRPQDTVLKLNRVLGDYIVRNGDGAFSDAGGTLTPIVPDFTGVPTTGAAPLTVTFTNSTTGIVDTYYWDFGDGNTSMEKNPSHQYASPGTYTVVLTATGPEGSVVETKTDYITAT